MFMLTQTRRFIAVLAFMLFALQSVSVAHDYISGDQDHEHNGQVCSIALVAPDADILPAVPVVMVSGVQIFTPPAYAPQRKSEPFFVYAPRPPPGRGPPSVSF